MSQAELIRRKASQLRISEETLVNRRDRLSAVVSDWGEWLTENLDSLTSEEDRLATRYACRLKDQLNDLTLVY